MNPVFGLFHGLDYLATALLVGALVFSGCIETAGGGTAKRTFEGKRNGIALLAACALAAAAVWFVLVAADMAESWHPADWLPVATATSFGHWWAWRAGAILLLLGWNRAGILHRVWWMALVLPVLIALSGHAGAEEAGRLTSLGLDTLHFLAVSFWTGGLFSLALWLKDRIWTPQLSPSSDFDVVRRFSHFAMASTALIATTGVMMAYRFGVKVTAPWASAYGKLVLAKSVIFVAALMPASINQFVHLKGWRRVGEGKFVRGIYREVRFEIVLVSLAFLVAGFLTRLSPPGH